MMTQLKSGLNINRNQLSIFEEENNSVTRGGVEKEEVYYNALGYTLPWEEETAGKVRE